MEATLPVARTTERSPEAKRRLGQVYTLLLQLDVEHKAPDAVQAARPGASRAEHVPVREPDTQGGL